MTDQTVHRLSWLDRILLIGVCLVDSAILLDHFQNFIRGDLPRWVPLILTSLTYAGVWALYVKLRKYSRVWKFVMLSLLLLATVIVILVFIPPKVVASEPAILVCDLDNYTGNKDFSDRGLRKLFTVALERSKRVGVLSEEETKDALIQVGKPTDSRITVDVGREICIRKGIRTLVAWNIRQYDDTYLLQGQIEDPSTGRILKESRAGPFTAQTVIEAIGSVAADLRKGFGDSSIDVYGSSKELAAATTTSLPALQAYSEAEEELGELKYQAAKPHLLRAVELDSNFALALRELASLYEYEGDLSAAMACVARAYELRDRLTEPERIRVDEYYYWLVLNDHERALTAVLRFLERYPKNRERLGTLAYLAATLMKFDTAEAANRRWLGPPPWGTSAAESAVALWQTQLSQNKFGMALETAEELQRDIPNLVRNPYLIVISKLSLGDADAAVDEISDLQRAGSSEGALWLGGFRDLYQGKLQSAQGRWRDYATLISQPGRAESPWVSSAGNAYLWAARVSLLRGDIEEARRDLDQVVDVRDEFLAEAGKFYARLGNLEKAQQILNRLRSRLGGRLTNQNRSLVQLLAGEIELKKRNSKAAYSLISEAATYTWTYLYWPLQESLANSALIANHCEVAVEVYERMLDRKGFAFKWDRPDDWILVHYGLGRANECRGRTDLALGFYMQLEQLWRDGDPDIPLLRDARKRIAFLKR